MSRVPREVCPALISPLLVSLPDQATPEEVLRRPPREAWPLAKVLDALLMKMGRTNLPAQPRRGPQAGKSGDPRSQNANKGIFYCTDNSENRHNILFLLYLI